MSKSLSETDESTSIEQKIREREYPYRDAEIIDYLYWERGMSLREVAEKLDCSDMTVGNWLDKHDIPTRDQPDVAGGGYIERATYVVYPEGHSKWVVCGPDDTTINVPVARLLAVADGHDPADIWNDERVEVHHSLGMPIDLPGFVEPLTSSEHRHTHAADEWRMTEDGIPALVSQTDDGA